VLVQLQVHQVLRVLQVQSNNQCVQHGI
jgi:hypothetical protein